MKTERKLDSAWQLFFKSEGVLDHVNAAGHFDVDTSTLKKITGEEPRILAKWDTSSQVPKVFAKSGLGIFPISRKAYRIAPFSLFHKLEFSKLGKIESLSVPTWARSLQPDFAKRSENLVLSACFASGLFQSTLCEDQVHELFPAISGRLSTKSMNFSISHTNPYKKQIPLSTGSLQFEIDGSYESSTNFGLIEAKNKFLPDFNIRQLYVPWRYLTVTLRKRIRPFFLMASNEIVYLFEYQFSNPNWLNSIELVSANRYSFAETDITLEEIMKTSNIGSRKVKKSSSSSNRIFPQANNFNLVIDICERLSVDASDGLAIAEAMEYDPRQGSYYGDAACFLGLAQKDSSGIYKLTKLGRTIFAKPYKERVLSLIERIVSEEPFGDCLEWTLRNHKLPDTKFIAAKISESKWNLSGTTPARRASTVKGWIRWILDQRTDR